MPMKKMLPPPLLLLGGSSEDAALADTTKNCVRCSSRGPEFSFQHLTSGSSQTSVTLAPGGLMPLVPTDTCTRGHSSHAHNSRDVFTCF